MKELTPGMMIAVFEEMFGMGLFWALVAGAVLVTLAFLFVVLRDRKLVASRLVRAELLAPIGAIAAILFVQFVTSSGFSDIGGPVDVIALILIGVAGAGGLTVLAYVLQGLLGNRAGKAS
ncbi:DUF5368 domain-containing protein [Pannonibacter carbonis]|uniref:DUF5368 domain-containing protein n=1 Tax=Pannonibacter carbonis TaxID=2067569 RepID=UPI000D0F6CBD|nr:DUF5368 domain-containing protein [Pannonibacter carbonis]